MPNHIHGILILHGNENNTWNENECATNNVETRHALSLQTSQTPKTSQTTIDNVKTRHALSLQTSQSPQSTESLQTPGQNRFRNQGKNTVSSIIGSYKSAVTKHAHRLGYEFGWQSRMWDHIVFNDESFVRITEYIQKNPLNWKDDKFYQANG
jgi:hypothetical protein